MPQSNLKSGVYSIVLNVHIPSNQLVGSISERDGRLSGP
jgi:hypothetical protein